MVAAVHNPQEWTLGRFSALKALISHAAPEGSGSLRAGDLGNRQDVADYGASPNTMWRYTHMYGAKHPCGWVVARKKLKWSDEKDRPLVVLGAGSLLCATGWTLFDEGPREIHAFDVLDWSPVLDSKPGRKLQKSLGHVQCEAGVFFPMTATRRPSQLRHMGSIRALQRSDIPRGATVLMPMMLNHLLEGGRLPIDTRRALETTFKLLRARRCRLVIADLASRYSSRLWQDLAQITGSPQTPSLVDLREPIQHFQFLYAPAHQAYRTFQRHPTGARLRMLAWDGTQWTGV